MIKFKGLHSLEIVEEQSYADCQKFILNKFIAFFEII